MALFQQSVIKKHIQELDKPAVKTAFDKFKKHFDDIARQNNIRELKEEQYQEGFLRELFVEILGYTINPEPGFNLLTELKNEKDTKKADGAIILRADQNLAGFENLRGFDKVIAIIELKGTDTTDLSKVETQAFGYKNNQKDCKYVITSNFEKLRFYIDDAIDFEEFNLFNLSEERFQLLYLCLAAENLLNGIPKKIKEASLSQEENITKKLYSDYSAFKRVLFQNIVELNPQYDKLTLFKKTQKLLDRFLFIFFAEDRLLLPPNSIIDIIKQWEYFRDHDNYIALYSRYIRYFGHLNTGYKGKNYDIFAYNGGLFATDEILDKIKIDDVILHEHTLKLSNYDFDTEVDVNILGHIFEHSLNEIEEIQAEIEGKVLDKSKTKRKKDGVFYTPKYITKYIVENTVGVLCTEKKKELEINEPDLAGFKNLRGLSSNKTKKKELLDKIDAYREWLLKLTICDPACGSGAFLNQALDFLLAEHRNIDELKARITGSQIIFSDIENSVLENNIFGVDINEEAVEIARLSLWLKTAQKGRKLADLSRNIKCGNSLIDNPTVAGDKAFNWFLEFPQVFPHYRNKTYPNIEKTFPKFKTLEKLKEPEPGDKDYLDEVQENMVYYDNNNNDTTAEEPLFSYKPASKGFVKHGFDVIIGNPPYVQVNSSNYNNYHTQKCNDLYVYFFEKALNILKDNGYCSFITPNLFIKGMKYEPLRNYLLNNSRIIKISDQGDKVFQDVQMPTSITMLIKTKYENQIWNTFIFGNEINIKINSASLIIQDIAKIIRGLEIGKDKVLNKTNDIRFLTGENIFRYGIKSYCYIENAIYNQFKKDNYFFEGNRLIIRETGNRITTIFLNDNTTHQNRSLYSIKIIDESRFHPLYILSILNSRTIQFYYQSKYAANTNIFPKIRIGQVKELPIKNISLSEQQPFVEQADLMLSLNKTLHEASQKFQRTIQRKFNLDELPKKLQDWYSHSFADFISELSKKKVKLSLTEEAEWEDYFIQESKKALEIKEKIKQTDDLIDDMVYKLYGLTPDEIAIINEK